VRGELHRLRPSVRPERSRGAPPSEAEAIGISASLDGVSRLRSTRTVWGGPFFLAVLSAAAPALADSRLPPSPYAYTQLPDPGQEAEAKALMESLRCLVCQGQSIADSDAEMAGDMRALVRERIEKPEAIRRWLVDRYGDWVSYAPPVEPLTWPLWAAPLLLLGVGLLLARGRFRKRAKA
jgi:cytochrome c-type biogenesis protein CcmH